MDSLLFLGNFVILAIPVAIIYLLISSAGLKRRITALEAKTAQDAAQPVQVTQTAPKPAARPTPMVVGPDTSDPKTAPPAPPEPPATAIVLNAGNLDALIQWVMQNWFYVVSAVSLSLAGIFLVLYGMEQGLLPPSVRIIAALAFGVALVGAGEFIRRRYGDGDDSSTAYLPSTFSGAGIVTLFAAVLSARLLYGFISPEVALIGMTFVGILALVLGWFYGPLLAGVGVIGAMIAPFVVGGTAEDVSWVLAYFTIVTLVGLAIDTLRRWAWVSVISLVLGFGAGLLLTDAEGWLVSIHFMIYCTVLAVAAIAIPVRRLVPDHSGASFGKALLTGAEAGDWPEFPTRLAAGGVIAASVAIALFAIPTYNTDVFWAAITVLAALTLGLLIWARNAPAISDLAIVPAVAMITVVAGAPAIWQAQVLTAQTPEADMPLMPSILVGLGMLVSIIAAWRSLLGGSAQLVMAAGAALFAPILAIALEVIWHPADTIGSYVWALHSVAIGALMVVMAGRFAHVDGPTARLRTSFAVLSALACIAFGVVIIFTSAALTTALAVTIVAAAWLDRQYDLLLMGGYILAGISTVGYRLVVDPGLEWATQAPFPEMLLSYGGAVLAFAVAWALAKAASRPKSEVLLESAVFSSVGILMSMLLYRAILSGGGEDATMSHWSVGINATIWIALGLAQLRRLQIGGTLAILRKGLAGVFLLIGGVQIAVIFTVLNPLFDTSGPLILGPGILNTLIPAYLLPAIILAVGAGWLRDLPGKLAIGLCAVAVGPTGVWLGLTVRHFWRGAAGMPLPDIGQPELYSYTVALLIIGAGLFYQSLAQPSVILRKAGLFVIGLAVAKVFMVDISGLGGLIRVFSLLFLGLALAGLAWLNRWATNRSETP